MTKRRRGWGSRVEKWITVLLVTLCAVVIAGTIGLLVPLRSSYSVISVIAGGLTAAALLYTIYLRVRTRESTNILYELHPWVPIAESVSERSGHKIKIMYENDCEGWIDVPVLFARYLRFANFGYEALKSADIPDSDPIRVEFEGSGLLKLSVVNTDNNSSRIRVAPMAVEPNKGAMQIQFEFLNPGEGALLEMIATTPLINLEIKGSIIGNPKPVREGFIPRQIHIVRSGWAGLVSVMVLCLLILSVAYVHVTGGWTGIWLLYISPFVALFPALTLLGGYGISVLWGDRPRFHSGLQPPEWYVHRQYLYDICPCPDCGGWGPPVAAHWELRVTQPATP